MSDYTVTTDFSVKDGLSSGDPNKLIVGSQFDTEFDAIAVAVNSKADAVASPVANNLIKQDATGENIDADSISDDGTDVSIATGRNLKVVDNGGLYIAGTQITSTAAELNKLDGYTGSAADLNNLSGRSAATIWGSDNDGAASGLDADLLDGQHGAYYRDASNINAGTIGSAYLPTANTTTVGALETATAAEANALSVTDKIITPGTIPTASATQAGVAELSTDAEAKTGTATNRVLTPANMRALGGEVLLETLSPSAASTVDFGTVFEDYPAFEWFEIRGWFYSGTAAANLLARISDDSGATYEVGTGYKWTYDGYELDGTPTAIQASNNADGEIHLCGAMASSAGSYIHSFNCRVVNPQDGTAFTRMSGRVDYENNDPNPAYTHFHGCWRVATAVDGIRFLMSSGTITGEFRVYGIIT